ncbi:MAG TPA: MlaD family protein [Candidatus Hydrogenedentes bacterium]|mgnify:CR=1 FL=1|nr:MlaD family protein [Candidatus Hydrogenedentota bacterium]HPG67395.1 MlaD family protein [Candidatus Hydrogenedentota bacterium]
MPAKKHNFTVVEIKAGAMVIASVAVLILFFAVISGLRPPDDSLTFYASFTNTGGLNRGADVRFGGAKVGRVLDITLDDIDQSRILVQFSVQRGTPVNEGSMASIGQTTLTAEKHLEISTGEKGGASLADGAEIPAQQGGLFEYAASLAGSVQEVLADVAALMGVDEAVEKEARGEGEAVTIADLFANVDRAVDEGTGLVQETRGVIGDSSEDISRILDKVQEIEDSAKGLVNDIQGVLAENRENIRATVGGVRTTIEGAGVIVDDVKKVSARLEGLTDTIQAILDNAQLLSADAQGLIEENRPTMEDLLLDLRETLRSLRELSQTLAEQPQAIIRGKAVRGRE